MGLRERYVRRVDRSERRNQPQPGLWRTGMVAAAVTALCGLALFVEGEVGRHVVLYVPGALLFLVSLVNVAQCGYRASRDRRRVLASRVAAERLGGKAT